MKFTKKPLAIGGLTLGLAGGAFLFQGGSFGEVSAAEQADLIAQAELTEEEVTAIATEEVAGEVIEMEVEKEGDTIEYEFEIQTDTVIKEVEVDANTGEVVGVETDDDEDDEAEDDDGEENAA